METDPVMKPPPALIDRPSLMQIARRLFGPDHGIELELPQRSAEFARPPVDFANPEYDP